MDLSFILCILTAICLLLLVYFYISLFQMHSYVEEMAKLLRRTFVEYYKGQDIEPLAIYNGIDLKWNGDVDGLRAENDNGFITIRLHDNGSINSPLNELDEADELSERIIRTVHDFMKDKEV